MAKYKGSGIDAIRKIMQKRGLEQTFLEKLSPADREIYTRVLTVSWLPVREDPGNMGVAAELLFPAIRYNCNVWEYYQRTSKYKASTRFFFGFPLLFLL